MSERAKPDRMVWIGRSASALVIAALLMDASVQFFVPDLAADMLRDAGLASAIAPVPGTIMVACVRLGQPGSPPELISLLLGLLAWVGIYLRDRRLHSLLPIRQ